MAEPKPMSDDDVCSVVAALVRDAENYRDERSQDRVLAMEYFDGIMNDVPADDGKSRVVSRDVRAAIKKVLPSLLRTILGNDQIVEYTPVGEGDEASAEQATDYVNYVALPECNGRQAIEDSINDAVRLRNGIIKWWQETKIDVRVSLHTGLDDMAFEQLVSDDGVEVLEHTARTEQVETPEGVVPVPAHDVKIKRRIETSKPKLAAIAPENWLIHPDAITLDDAPIMGENCKIRRSDLVAMGYDRDRIANLPITNGKGDPQDAEEQTRRRNTEIRFDEQSPALQELDYYDLLVRIDQDDDGIAELRRMVFAGGLTEENLLDNTEWDEINYADIVSESRPHQWEGNSISDDTMEIQKIKTVLLRQTMDNLYWQNNLQPIVQEGKVKNPEAVLNPKFGLPIRVEEGTPWNEAIGWSVVPMVADKSFAMLDYMDKELEDRTGVTDASSGMAPDALQTMTAKASAMVEAAGIGQTEMMVRCIANSLKPVFRGLLKLIIQHQDKPRVVRLRKQWVEFDPRTWNADMDASVNVGLGAGTRERDMIAMQQVIALQKEILAAMGPNIGGQFVTADNIYNSVSKMVEAAGLKTVQLYFTKPDQQAIEQALQAQSQQPSPEQVKAQAALQLEKARTEGKKDVEAFKVQAKTQENLSKMQADANKEREQRDADLATNMAEMDRQAAIDSQKIEADLMNNTADRQVEYDRMQLDYRMHQEDIASREQLAARNAQANIEKAQAGEIGRAIDRGTRQ